MNSIQFYMGLDHEFNSLVAAFSNGHKIKHMANINGEYKTFAIDDIWIISMFITSDDINHRSHICIYRKHVDRLLLVTVIGCSSPGWLHEVTEYMGRRFNTISLGM